MPCVFLQIPNGRPPCHISPGTLTLSSPEVSLARGCSPVLVAPLGPLGDRCLDRVIIFQGIQRWMIPLPMRRNLLGWPVCDRVRWVGPATPGRRLCRAAAWVNLMLPLAVMRRVPGVLFLAGRMALHHLPAGAENLPWSCAFFLVSAVWFL